MAEHHGCYVHTEGDPTAVLFQLPYGCREFREGDTFTYKAETGASTVYKIESVDYRVEKRSAGPGPGVIWRPPVVYYGVSVVP